MYPGIADRMHKELTMLAPPSVKVSTISNIHLVGAGELTIFLSSGQNLCTSRAEIFRLDRRIYLGVPQHIPELVDL